MGHMKKYICPMCKKTDQVIRYGYRKKVLRFLCKACAKHFSVNTSYLPRKALLNDHLNGFSFRVLGEKYGISKSYAWEICHEELTNLPDNNVFSHQFCNRFTSTLVVDGKYIRVKGYARKIALLWGIDYFTHDIPAFVLAPSENTQSWSKYFAYFRIFSHRPELLVCDDNINIKVAAKNCFPAVKIQTCMNHLKENMRRTLNVRNDSTYREVFTRLDTILSQKQNDQIRNKRLFSLVRDYQSDPLVTSLLISLHRESQEHIAYRNIKNAPLTTNIIECYNSHLEARLFPLKGFESYAHAKLWMNGYILKRRFTKLADCSRKFHYLTGCRPIDKTKKIQTVLPVLF